MQPSAGNMTAGGSTSPAIPAWRVRWLTVSRRAWPVLTVLAIMANLLALPEFARSRLTPMIRHELPAAHLTPAEYVALEICYGALFMVVCLAVSSVVYFRAAADRMALLCAYMLMTFGCGVGGFLNGLTINSPVLNALSVVLTVAGLVTFGWFFLVFPSGRFVPRWSRWCLMAAAAAALVIVTPSIVRVQPVSDSVQMIGVGLLLLAVGAQVYRYRQVSTLAERQQTKWVVLGVAACVAVFVGSRLVGLLLTPAEKQSQVGGNLVGGGLVVLAFFFVPVCIGIAVLRARLWDIGLVVSRTLTYAVVTALLAGIYAGLVLLATRVLPFHTAPAVAVSTLVAAAAFHPLRVRVQHAVDRRFNRARYDADRAVAAFAARLQDTADPDAVHAHLLAAVHRALEPAHASVWINQR
jgi:hypothetical protein